MSEGRPQTLAYGTRVVPWWRRRSTPVLLVLAVLIAAFLSQRIIWPRLVRWQAARTQAYWANYFRERSIEWYPKACSWTEPTTTLKFTTAEVDLARLRSGTDTPKALSFGGAQGFAFRSEDPRSYFIVDDPAVFWHLRRDRTGVARLICVDADDPHRDALPLNVTICDALPDGRAVQTSIGRTMLDLKPLGDVRELRVFAGQPDPDDASRFTIPFESHGRPGVIDGVFESASVISQTRGNSWPPRAIECGVRLTLRVPTTRPAAQ